MQNLVCSILKTKTLTINVTFNIFIPKTAQKKIKLNDLIFITFFFIVFTVIKGSDLFIYIDQRAFYT